MYTEVLGKAVEHDIYIGAAAVADYRPVLIEKHKIKKSSDQTTLTLQKNRDILADVALLANNRPFTVGFAAETDNLEQYAQDKLAKKNMDMIAANRVGQIPPGPSVAKGDLGGFDSDQNALEVFWNTGHKTLAMTDKNYLAEQLIQLIAERMEFKNT
jgi:phosphopantothenoylcysteine decarboxylase/phosphopantothenate--cysteine ligase